MRVRDERATIYMSPAEFDLATEEELRRTLAEAVLPPGPTMRPRVVPQRDRPVTDVLRKLLADLVDQWIDGADESWTPRGAAFPASLVVTVIALTAHTHRLAGAVGVLIDAGFDVETAPMVRSVLEHGVTAQWIVQCGNDAMFEMVDEETRQRLNIANLVEEVQEVMGLAGAGEIIRGLGEEISSEQTAAHVNARGLDKLCDDFRGGKSIYLTYRVLSSYVHPGPTISGMYVASEQPPAVQLEPNRDADPGGWLYPTCAGLVWAARAVDILNPERPRRLELRAAARTLGIPEVLTASDAGWLRRQRDPRARRRARVVGRDAQL